MTNKEIVKCHICECDVGGNNIGLNKKLFGRKITKLKCLACMADFLDVTEDDLLDKIEEFKDEGCTLFL